MGGGRNQESTSSGRARVFELFFFFFFFFVVKELKLLLACGWMDTSNPTLRTATHR